MTLRGRLDRLLVSQDAGWYHVGEPAGGTYRPHTFLLETLVPALLARGLTEAQTRALLVVNPARALEVGRRTRGVQRGGSPTTRKRTSGGSER
jgi:phosphotriesterase-related protein